MRWVTVVLALSGCSSILGIEDFKVGGDGGGDGSSNEFCLGPVGWRICVAEEPTNDEAIGSETTLDTNPVMGFAKCLATQPKSWKDAGQPDACIYTARNIDINSLLHARNALRSRPLVLFAANNITLTAPIDVASSTNGSTVLIGAGADPARCMNPATPANSTGPGGGAGGSFMQKGGDGGRGTVATGSLAKDADATRPVVLRGGCAGANGGKDGAGGPEGGVGGQGGGAIYLVAGNRITIGAHSINASGSRGQGVLPGAAGGGGGGSGGMIVLHAPTITGTGTLIANGGGGSGGVGGSASIGSPGNEANVNMPMSPAGGGLGGGNGGRGGAGFAGFMDAVNGTAAAVGGAPGGGGGGGGGGGYIMTTTNTLITSPDDQPF